MEGPTFWHKATANSFKVESAIKEILYLVIKENMIVQVFVPVTPDQLERKLTEIIPVG